MLLQIRDYLAREHVASLQQIARAFRLDSDALVPMLAIWERRGVIRARGAGSACKGGCVRCPVVYQYVPEA